MELHKEAIFLSFHSLDSSFILYQMCINFLLLMDLQTSCAKCLCIGNYRWNLFLHYLDVNLRQASHFRAICIHQDPRSIKIPLCILRASGIHWISLCLKKKLNVSVLRLFVALDICNDCTSVQTHHF